MPDDDVTTTLGELERKLADLERELQAAVPEPEPDRDAGPAAPPTALSAAVAPLPDPFAVRVVAAPAPAPTLVLPSADGEGVGVEALLQFRAELERSARALMAECERVLGELVAATDAALGAAAGPEPGPPPPEPALDEVVMDGVVAVEAGPFADMASLAEFEQALLAASGVTAVAVRHVEQGQALADVTLGHPVALGAELARTARVPFTITQAEPSRLVLSVG